MFLSIERKYIYNIILDKKNKKSYRKQKKKQHFKILINQREDNNNNKNQKDVCNKCIMIIMIKKSWV